MLQVPGNSKASKQHYNVVSDRCISFDGIAKIVAKGLGQEPNIVHYDPSKVRTGMQAATFRSQAHSVDTDHSLTVG